MRDREILDTYLNSASKKYIRKRHFSSWDKIFVGQCNLKRDSSRCCSQMVLMSGPTVAIQCRWPGETAVIRRQEMHEG